MWKGLVRQRYQEALQAFDNASPMM